MLLPLLSFLAGLQLADPVEAALLATEAPKSVRVAFEVELRSPTAVHVYAFDPRLEGAERWRVVSHRGEDAYLDEVGANWAAEDAPDSRLFPDDLRVSLGASTRPTNVGAAWKLSFKHAPSANDGTFDIWAAENLRATAWLSPVDGRFLRIDYILPRPVRLPEGGRLMRYDQSYLLEADPVFGFSLITAFTVDLEARGGFRTERRTYSMSTRNVEVFFVSPEAQAQYIAALSPPEADGSGGVR